MPMPTKDETNNVYGKLKVIGKSNKTNDKNLKSWICKCECGNITEVFGSNLRSGGTTSCGCYRANNESNYKFAGYEEISGSYWSVLKSRCKLKDIELSITIEQAWEVYINQNRKCALTGLDLCFVKVYNKERQNQNASLDRIDSSKGYTIDNIQWVHKDINRMKSDFEQNLFIEYCKLVVKNSQKEDL